MRLKKQHKHKKTWSGLSPWELWHEISPYDRLDTIALWDRALFKPRFMLSWAVRSTWSIPY